MYVFFLVFHALMCRPLSLTWPPFKHTHTIFNASAATKIKAEDEVITQGKLPIKAEDAVLKLSAISYRVALDEDWPADPDEMANHPECPVIGELGVCLRIVYELTCSLWCFVSCISLLNGFTKTFFLTLA